MSELSASWALDIAVGVVTAVSSVDVTGIEQSRVEKYRTAQTPREWHEVIPV